MITIAFFNNKGGVGNTSLVYHLAWMFKDLGLSVVAADFDPQAHLTSMFLNEDRLMDLWSDGKHLTIESAIGPGSIGSEDIQPLHLVPVTENLRLIAGNLELSAMESRLSEAWTKCQNRDQDAFCEVTVLCRALLISANQRAADIVLIDVGPNLTAVNRCALIAADFVVVPLASDLFALQGLRIIGPRLREWRDTWVELKTNTDLLLPSGSMLPLGYVLMRQPMPLERYSRAHLRSVMGKISSTYRTYILNDALSLPESSPVESDDYHLASLKHYPSLMPLAMESHKPMFHLRPADGAIGSNIEAVKDCYQDFKRLAMRIAESTGLELPTK